MTVDDGVAPQRSERMKKGAPRPEPLTPHVVSPQERRDH
jgi:hypothetical protein